MEKFTLNKLELCIARTESGFIFCGGDIYGIKINRYEILRIAE